MMNYVSTALPQPAQAGSGMNAQQNTDLQNLLSSFDPENLGEKDAFSLVKGIREIGIGSSHALGEALTNAGFDAEEIAQKAGLRDEETAPPTRRDGGPRGEINSAAIAALSQSMEGYGIEELSEDDWAEIFADMADKGINLSDSLLDIKV